MVAPMRLSFAAPGGSAEHAVFEPGFGLRQRTNAALRRLWLAVIMLPDRGRHAIAQELPAEFFRFPPF
jgi:hypothetical protein